MALATLSIDLEAKLAKLQSGLDRAGRLAEINAARMEKAFEGVRTVAVGIGGALGAGLAGFSAVGFIKASVDSIDALNDVADATGSTIEKISSLEQTALETGTTMETVSTALVKFNAVLNEAKPNSPIAQALQRIGLNAEELKRLDPADALRKTAEALAGYADDGNKARLIQELFGKSLKEVAPYLKDLAENGERAAKVTTAQAEEAEKFNKQLFQLQTNATNVGRAFVSDLLPAFNSYFETLNRIKNSGGGSFFAELKSEIQGLRLKAAADDVVSLTDQLTRAVPGSDSANTLAALLKQRRKDYEELSKAAASANEKLKQTLGVPESPRDAGAGRGFINPPVLRPSVPGLAAAAPKVVQPKEEIDQSVLALSRYIDGLQKQNEKLDELSETQKALNFLRGLGELGANEQVRERVIGLANEIELRTQAAAVAKEMTEELERQAAAQQKLDDAIDQFSGRTADALKQLQTSRLEARLAAGEVFSPEELDNIVKGIAGIGKELDPVIDKLDRRFEQFAQSVQSTLGDTIEQTLRGDFDNIGKMWGDLLIRMASQAAAAEIATALFGDTSKQGSGTNAGLLSELFKGVFGGGRATGGPVSAGKLYEVNETGQGPGELLNVGNRQYLLSNANGTVKPASSWQTASGAAIHQTNTYTIVGSTDPASVQRQIDAALAANNQRLMRAQRYAA